MVDARLRQRVMLALREAKDVIRWLNWKPRAFRSPGELVQRHRREGQLTDDAAHDFAVWVAVNEMRNLAEKVTAAYGRKHAALRVQFCEAIAILFDTGPVDINVSGVSLWTAPQLRRIHELRRSVAPVLMVGLWDLPVESLRRLRCCGFPYCRREWFLDTSTRRPALYCQDSHRVRTAEACAPLRKRIVEVIGRARGWVTRDVLEAGVRPDDPYFFATALQRLIIEGKIRFRTTRPQHHAGRSREPESAAPWLPPIFVTEYRLA